MWTDEHLKQQLVGYSDWLEDHLGSDLRPSPAAVVRGHRRRNGSALLAVVGVGSAIALIAVTVSRESDNASTVVPVVPASTAQGTSTTVLATAPSESATTWAPVNLPDGMRVVDVSWGSELSGFSPLATQDFARLAADGTTLDATLSVLVSESEQTPPVTATGEVHGVPVSFVQDDTAGVVVGWWVEDHMIIEFQATGFTLEQMTALFDAATWRSDAAAGFEPSSIAGGLSLLSETVGGAEPRPFTRFVVETGGSYVVVEVSPGVARITDASLVVVPGVGQLLEENPGATVVLTDDGTTISISDCCGPKGGPNGASPEALAIAGAFAHVDDETVVSLASAAVARELALPEVGRVTVGANEVVLRGGTQALPEALCVVVSGVEGCTINHRFPAGTTDDLRWGNEWLLAGDNWFFLMYRPTDVGFGTASVCPADANGQLGEPLPYDQTIEGDRMWTVTQISADVAFTTVCGWARDGEPIDLVPSDNVTEIVRRPPTHLDQTAAVESLLIGVPVPPGFDVTTLGPTADITDPNERYQLIAHVAGAVACSWLDAWFTATENGDTAAAEVAASALATSREWPMLLEIQNEGAWADAVWQWADAINGGPGILTGGGPMPPSRELAVGGLGCETP